MPVTTTRLAVLIDADNTSPKHISALLDELASYGVATVKRAYGDWTADGLAGWRKVLPDHGIEQIQQPAHTVGKNATDIALIIDAMDLLYDGNLDAFALVSSDSDFTKLAMRLRASGKTVYGLGQRKTPRSLVSACDKFIYLEDIGAADEQETAEAGGSATELKRLLTRAVNNRADDSGWADLGAVGQYLSSARADFDSRHHGHSKLINLVKAQDYLEVEHEDGRPARIRLASKPPERTARKQTGRRPAKKAAKRTTTKKAQAGG